MRRVGCMLLLCVFQSVYLVGAEQRKISISASPSDMKVDGGGRVFLAVGSQLFRLDSTLALQENVTLGSSVMRVALSYDERRVVVCLGDLSCAVYNASDFGAGEQLRRMDASDSSDVVALFTAEENSFYVGSFRRGASSFNLGQYGFGNRNLVRIMDYNFSRSNFERIFFGGFVKGANAYYFVADQHTSNTDLRGLRVLRACDISNCTSPCNFEALYEVRIDCGSDTFPRSSVICGLSVLDSFAGSSDTTVVLARCSNTGSTPRNRVCSFRLADIDNRMDTYYTQCVEGTGEIEVSWDGIERQCSSGFSAQGVCQFSPPLGDVDARGSDPGSPVSGSQRLDFGDTVITASAAITVDSTSIVYVGYTNSSGNHFIGEFYITITSFLVEPGSAFSTRDISSRVRQLQWQSGLDYVYVATDSSVFRIPLEECTNFTDCESCISYNNPLCGWCTVEDKCSRRTQCQNTAEPGRWVQEESSLCISTVVTPNQFVLDDPEIFLQLTVTVSPGLPPLLTNESYWCQFTDRGGGSMITVDADEATSNTEYTCNITGRIPAFTGVQLVTDFSFVSSDVGVPFATNVNALTVTRCESASSCSQCLQTNNACGWCIYNKVCSGTPAPCSNETNWYQLNTSTTYVDVCPLLEPSSTPISDYVQPVGVDRDIQLQTRNLPAPISGFRYDCRLRDIPDLPTAYNNESSLTCLVAQNQILPSSSTGREDVNVSIIWVNISTGRQHTIDTLTPVKLILYNCTLLETGCSSCLGANLETGFDCGWCGGSSADNCRVSEECLSPANFVTSSTQCHAPQITSVTLSTVTIAVAVAGPIAALVIITVVIVLGVFIRQTKRKIRVVEEVQRLKAFTVVGEGTVPKSSGFQVTEEFISSLPRQLIVPSNHLQLFESVGRGEFGVVYRGKLLRKQGRNRPGTVAVKTMRGLSTSNDVHSMMDKVLKMQSFDHPHVMTLIGVCLDAGPGLALVMPYMANGSLLAYLKNERPNLDLTDDAELETIFSVRKLLLRTCHQTALGMEYLTLQKFVHRDLAARNCMLDGSGNIKVSDFGLVYTRGYFRQSKDDSGNVCLPYKWIPPESLQDGIFSEKSDVWAFGVTCWEVFMAGKIPYPAVDPTSLLKMLESGQRLEKPPNAACAEVYSVMRKCWRADPAERPTFSELASTLDRLLQSVAGYVELSMTLPVSEIEPEQADMETADQPDPGQGEPVSDDEIRNPVYNVPDKVLVLENPACGSLPAATSQPPITATDGDEQQSDGDYEPIPV